MPLLLMALLTDEGIRAYVDTALRDNRSPVQIRGQLAIKMLMTGWVCRGAPEKRQEHFLLKHLRWQPQRKSWNGKDQ
jgi:hypothetical protein